jgi:hypothetical protein
VREKPPVPWWRWASWWCLLAPALVLFYGLFTPIWLGVRLARLFAEARSRRTPTREPAAPARIPRA